MNKLFESKEKLGPPRVVRLKRKNGKIIQDCDDYIGRRVKQGGWDLKESIWKNPFTMKDCKSRKECLQKYETYLRDKPELMDAIPELTGKRLGCWCSPLPCHGEILVKIWKEWKKKQEVQ